MYEVNFAQVCKRKVKKFSLWTLLKELNPKANPKIVRRSKKVEKFERRWRWNERFTVWPTARFWWKSPLKHRANIKLIRDCWYRNKYSISQYWRSFVVARWSSFSLFYSLEYARSRWKYFKIKSIELHSHFRFHFLRLKREFNSYSMINKSKS